MNRRFFLPALPWVALATAVACSSASTPSQTLTGSGETGSGASASGGSSTAGSGASGGVASSGGGDNMAAGSSGQLVSSGATSGQTSGSINDAMMGSGSATGLAATDSGGVSTSSDAGNMTIKGRTGKKSAGCGLLPNGDTSAKFTDHKIAFPACAACTPPNCPDNCIAPPWVPGGPAADTAADGENYLNRDFSVELPTNYQPTTAYPVFYGGDGCGVPPPQTGAGFTAHETGAIEVGLQYVGSCFADGGTSCAVTVANEPLCVNGPEIPYFRAVMSWIESHYCVDLGNEFIGGGSSGAWEALTVGCGVADSLRGTISVAGGKREHRWPCTGPVAAFMIVDDDDTNNPVGPLATINTELDSYGSKPARDELLMRNGCVGTATTVYDPQYPECVKYTGCPPEYPVVWCELPSGGHDNTTFNTIDYSKAEWPFLTNLPPAP
jgi:hypothetical protein